MLLPCAVGWKRMIWGEGYAALGTANVSSSSNEARSFQMHCEHNSLEVSWASCVPTFKFDQLPNV